MIHVPMPCHFTWVLHFSDFNHLSLRVPTLISQTPTLNILISGSNSPTLCLFWPVTHLSTINYFSLTLVYFFWFQYPHGELDFDVNKRLLQYHKSHVRETWWSDVTRSWKAWWESPEGPDILKYLFPETSNPIIETANSIVC